MAVQRIEIVRGTGLPLRGDNIDTDRIIPARFLRSVSFEGLEEHLFADDRTQADAAAPGTHPVSNPRYEGASILIVNANFGCGSSREHAPQAIRRRGINAVIGQSFSEIFFGNSVALGMPCVSASAEDVHRLQSLVEQDAATQIAIDLTSMTATFPGGSMSISLPAAAREAFVSGGWDATGLLLDRYEEIERVAAGLPYVAGW
jgi:3-isopropylmalate/(R)-2-methylmalate dehydratase small subunit